MRVAGLAGWADDDLAGAHDAYAATADLAGGGWPVASSGRDPRRFFEDLFRPCPPQEGLLTGYFEPELAGARVCSTAFPHPLYGLPPPPLNAASRSEITEGGVLRGLELAWVANPLDAFLVQVQGSVRIRLPEGTVLRLGFAGKNGWPYRSIGAELVRRGEVPESRISVQAIRDWCGRNPDGVADLLATNPSFVFFRPLDLPPGAGPLGAMGRSVAPLRSLAVDPSFIPLGAPVWVESFGPERFARLMIAQDTGGAIKGPGRGDVFIGSGPEAGERAGQLREPCRLTPLLPRGAA